MHEPPAGGTRQCTRSRACASVPKRLDEKGSAAFPPLLGRARYPSTLAIPLREKRSPGSVGGSKPWSVWSWARTAFSAAADLMKVASLLQSAS